MIFWSGRARPGFSAVMAASFHLVISPMKILASTSSLSFSWPEVMPATFTMGVTAPVTIGNCVSLDSLISSLFSGASVPAKSTVPSLIWLMPAPEPMDW